MKNTILVSSFLLFVVSANAQDGFYDYNKDKTRVSAGIEAGANMMNMTHVGYNSFDEVSASTEKYSYKSGIRLGVVMNVNFKQRIDLRSGIYYSRKGANQVKFIDPFDESGNVIHGQLKLNYLELPVNIFVHIGKSRNLYLGGGGYVAYAANGSYRIGNSDRLNDLNFTDKKSSYYSPTKFERLDYGVQVVAGYRVVKNLFLQGQFSRGLANIVSDANYIQPYSYKNWGFSLTAGWLFGDRH